MKPSQIALSTAWNSCFTMWASKWVHPNWSEISVIDSKQSVSLNSVVYTITEDTRFSWQSIPIATHIRYSGISRGIWVTSEAHSVKPLNYWRWIRIDWIHRNHLIGYHLFYEIYHYISTALNYLDCCMAWFIARKKSQFYWMRSDTHWCSSLILNQQFKRCRY